MAEVSIIVPIYNAERYLRDCIESVLGQTFTDWELILVDDGSTDRSNAIANEYKDHDRRIFLINKTNGGVSSARNTGLKATNGRYIFFLDPDDELYGYTISHLYETAKSYSADIVAGKYVYTHEKPILCPQAKTIRLLSAEKLCQDTLYQKKGTDNSVWGKLFDRSLFENLMFYDGWFEDLEIFHKLLFKSKKIAVSDEIVYFYRKHDQSFINSWSDGRKDIIKVTEGIIYYMSNSKPQLVKAAEHRHFSACYNLLNILLRYASESTETINYCSNEIKRLRNQILVDKDSRMKNRVGAFVSFFGLKFLKLIVR